MCNRHGDCSDGEDELPSLCLDRPNCFLPDFSCNQSNLCLPASKVCDDHFDCSQANSSDKSDEDPIFCSKTCWACLCVCAYTEPAFVCCMFIVYGFIFSPYLLTLSTLPCHAAAVFCNTPGMICHSCGQSCMDCIFTQSRVCLFTFVYV